MLAAALALVACGGDAFTAGTRGEDAGTTHDGSPPPPDTGTGNDSTTNDAPPGDALGEPPPTCTGNFFCVPDVPSGWQGPLELYFGTNPPPVCITGFAQSVGAFDGLQAPAANCGCACGASTLTCNPPSVVISVNATCGTAFCATDMLALNVCTTVDERTQCLDASPLDVTFNGGSTVMGPCAPQATRDVPAYSWSIQARGCAATAAMAQVDCASGQVCAPKPEPGFIQRLCVARAGDMSCPGNGYGVKHLFYTSVDDSRNCTSCTCGLPNGGSCEFSLDTYQSTDGSCSGGAITYGSTTKCAGVGQPSDMRIDLKSVPGSCAPSSSTATGMATPTGAVTVCCPL